MIILRVRKSPGGWSIVGGAPMSTVFLSLKAALDQANGMAEVLRRHGEEVDVLIEEGADS